jgi:glycerol-3-phosphate dehydrogenase
MAQDTLDAAAGVVLRKRSKSRTKRLTIVGGADYEAAPETAEPSLHEHLGGRYGTEMASILDLAAAGTEAHRDLSEALVPGLPYLRAEAVHAARHEMARTLDDVLSRRTRARLLARDASVAAAESVAALLAPELGWDGAETSRQVEAYRAAIQHERASGNLPEVALDASLGA